MNRKYSGDFLEGLSFADAPKISVNPPGPKARDLLDRQLKVDSQVLTYPRMMPLAPENGKGATLMDADGNYFKGVST